MKNVNQGILFAAVTAFCWSILAIALKFTLGFASSGTIVWSRMIVAFLILIFYYAIKKPAQLNVIKSPPLLGALAGLLLAANYFGYMKGIEYTSASNTQIMIQMAPLTLSLIGIFYFKERLKPIQLFGVLIAVCGFSFFYWDQILVSVNEQAKYITGNLWVLFAAMTWALFGTFQKILTAKGWSPQQLNLLIYLVASLALFPLADLSDFKGLELWQWLLLLALGINTLIAYGSLGEALKKAPASYVSLIITINPLGTIFLLKLMESLNWNLVSAEPIDWRGFLGAALVVTGVLITVTLKGKSSTANKSILDKASTEPS